MLTIRQHIISHVQILYLEGVLNADTSSELDTLLQKIAQSPHPRILLCVEKLEYISSAGMGCFIGSIAAIRQNGGDLRFCGMLPQVRRIFTLLDMDDFFCHFDSMEKGLASFVPTP